MNKTIDGIGRIHALARAAGSALALLGASAATAATISMNVEGVVAGGTMATTDSAGVVPTNYWNNVGGSPTWTNVALKDSNGVSSGATTTSEEGALKEAAYANSNPDGNYEMMAEAMAGDGGTFSVSSGAGSPSLISVSGLTSAYTFPSYDVYVYFSSTAASNAFEADLYAGGSVSTPSGNHFTATGGTDMGALYGSSGGVFAGSYSPAVSITSADPTPDSNYVEYIGLTASNFTVLYTQTAGTGSGMGVAGIEIVPVPEPASLGIMALLGVGCLRRRRR